MPYLCGDRLKDAFDAIVDAAHGVRSPSGVAASSGGGGRAGGDGAPRSPFGCTVLILVAPQADAICAARILMRLLESSGVSFKLVPVGGYAEVKNQCQDAGPSVRVGTGKGAMG